MRKTLEQKISEGFVDKLKKAEIAQVEIAIQLQISKGQVSKIFNGSKHFTLDAISDLSNRYQIPIADLFAKNIYKNADRELLGLFDEIEQGTFKINNIIDKKINKKAVS